MSGPTKTDDRISRPKPVAMPSVAPAMASTPRSVRQRSIRAGCQMMWSWMTSCAGAQAALREVLPQMQGEVGGIVPGPVDEGGLAPAHERQAHDVQARRTRRRRRRGGAGPCGRAPARRARNSRAGSRSPRSPCGFPRPCEVHAEPGLRRDLRRREAPRRGQRARARSARRPFVDAVQQPVHLEVGEGADVRQAIPRTAPCRSPARQAARRARRPSAQGC